MKKSYEDFYGFADLMTHCRLSLKDIAYALKQEVDGGTEIKTPTLISGKEEGGCDVDDFVSFNLEQSFGDLYIDFYLLQTNEVNDDGDIVYYITEVSVDGDDWKMVE